MARNQFIFIDFCVIQARAIRKVYAFPSDGQFIAGKLDPDRLISVLKEYMPIEYQKITIKELDDAIPSTKVPEEREVRKTDCSCCKVLERTRDRLKTVIENSEESPSCYRLNFAVFEELNALANDLNINFAKNEESFEMAPYESEKQQTHEKYLMEFEQQQIIIPNNNISQSNNEKQSQQNQEKPQLEPIPYKPPLRHISILPSFPGIPYAASPIQHFLGPPTFPLLAEVNGIHSLPLKTEPNYSLTPRKRTNPLSKTLMVIPTAQEPPPKKSPKLLLDSNHSRLSPIVYSQSRQQENHTSDYAKEIMNTKFIVFSKHDLRSLFPEKYAHIVQNALSTLESSCLIYSHTTIELTVYIKEIRRTRLKELWNYGIIPEHYIQRIAGFNSTELVRNQFEKYKTSLIEMNCKPQFTELIGTILESSNNSELEIEFGKFDSGSTDSLVYFVQKENSEAGISG
uniref:SPK domain-containing protein n=1 Tax=Caenorhabditis tropicalis TaxID=1561998 RepID=A0A1I7UQN6_9PELO